MATQALSAKTVRGNRLSTGIHGLDEILEGGLSAGHLYLLQGDPGTGKTTMALQFLLDGRRLGETVLYVTLSETAKELREVAVSHGWSLDGVHIRELTPAEEVLGPESQYTVFHPAEIELADTTKAILEFVDQISPQRVVIDSLSELRMLARDPLRYRREILWIKDFFLKRKITVLMLDDKTADWKDQQLQSIAHGVLSFETFAREYGSKRRRLEVVKMRGAGFRDGYHDYAIKTGGIEVYCRVSGGHGNSDEGPLSKDRLLSGIKELDQLLGGGLYRGTSTLITGPAGSGKSTLVTQYAHTTAQMGGRAALYMFDENIQTLKTRSTGLGMNLDPYINSGQITIRHVNPAELSPGEFANYVRGAVEERVDLVIIDSLNGYYNSMPGEDFLSLHMHELLSYLNQSAVTTLMVLAQHGFVGQNMLTPVDVSYLADTVCLLRFFEADGEVKQAISVLKNRGGNHERTIREFRMNGHIRVGQPLSDFSGVLSGVPVFAGKGKLMDGSRSGDNS